VTFQTKLNLIFIEYKKPRIDLKECYLNNQFRWQLLWQS